MALLKKEKEAKASKISMKSFILPAYIVLSAIFILFVIYGYFRSVVYGGGVAVWQNQALQAVINQANSSCDAFSLTSLDGSQVQLVNIACLQQQGQWDLQVPNLWDE